MGRVRVGISGWRYPPWRGTFYPAGLVQRRELAYVADRLDTVEINGSFYALQRPAAFQGWAEQTPDDFVFAVKGPRFITHMKKLRDVETPLANFLASGVLALGAKLGPLLWQLPPQLGYDSERMEAFLRLLPTSTREAARLARRHDERMTDRAWTRAVDERPLRHAVEVRHQSFACDAFTGQARRHGVAVVVADTAGKWPLLQEQTADFGYVRLHGDAELYVSGYSSTALDDWAGRIGGWYADGDRDVFVYFDNDVKVAAPYDAMSLAERVRQPPSSRSGGGSPPGSGG